MFKSPKLVVIERNWQTYDSQHGLVVSMLSELGVKFQFEYYRGEFSGTRYTIERPIGKGSVALTEKIYQVFEDYKLLEKYEKDFEALRTEMVWPAAWSRMGIIKEAAKFFNGCKNVLDIGSGVGKFVLIASQLNKETEFTGVEIDENYYNISLEAKEKLKVSNSHFIKDNFTNIDLTAYSGIYIFNPFIMSGKLQSERESIRHYESAINNLEKGTKLVMNCQCYKVPDTFKHIKNSQGTNYYIKQ